jgi:transposase
MKKIKFSEVSDELWGKVEPLLPVAERPTGRAYQRRSGGGRKPMMARQIFSAILYVLRSGCPWKALPRRFGCASTVHRHFLKWERMGFFLALWRAGLAEDGEMAGIRWVLGSGGEDLEEVSPATGAQAKSAGRRLWRPAVVRRQRR